VVSLLRRLRDFYLIQVDLIVRWRPGRRALLRHVAVSFVVAFLSLGAMAVAVEGIRVRDPVAGALAVVAFWAFNLLVRPVILALFAPISTVLLVLAAVILQVAAILVLEPLVPGVQVDSVSAAFVGSWVFAIVNTTLTAVFSISEDDSHFGALVRRLRMRRSDAILTTDAGLVIIQIDGLSHDVLKQQIHAGRAPTMSQWVRSGSHRLVKWDVLLPSQTSASQAVILHGRNDGIPAFRWWEKERGRLLVSNHPQDAAEIAARLSDGQGLLAQGGASINNLLSGDAPRSYLTMATLRAPRGGLGESQAFSWFFVSPYNYLHTIVRFIGETAKELFQARRQRRAEVEPRMDRGLPYPLLRATTNVVLRALGTSLILEEMYRGTPVIYADFTDYDEIAHHSGPERPDALDALDGVDRVLGTLAKAASDSARPYRFVVLSDHGQTLGATFRQRFGETLEQVVRGLMRQGSSVAAATKEVEEWGPIHAMATELARAGGVAGRMTRATIAKRVPHGNPPPGATGPISPRADGAPQRPAGAMARPDVVVCASGNLGLISFPNAPGRLTLEAIGDLHPGLVDGLAAHPGIGFVLVRSRDHGALCIGRDGVRFLDPRLDADMASVEGVDPLASFGEFAAESLRRLDGMTNAPDILAMSMYDPAADEVAAFEELIGSHGGLGGAQTRAFLLAPADWPPAQAPLVGAPAVYAQLRAWLEQHVGVAFAPRG
jgi:uncharacterized membrane protein YvlD (DUF360 family)